jgi:hypothetical protein
MPTAPRRTFKWIGWILAGAFATAACNVVLAFGFAGVSEYFGTPPGPTFFGISHDRVIVIQAGMGFVVASGCAVTFALYAALSERAK